MGLLANEVMHSCCKKKKKQCADAEGKYRTRVYMTGWNWQWGRSTRYAIWYRNGIANMFLLFLMAVKSLSCRQLTS